MVTFNYGFYTGKPNLQFETKLMKDIFFLVFFVLQNSDQKFSEKLSVTYVVDLLYVFLES